MQHKKKEERKKLNDKEHLFICMEFLTCFSDVILQGFWWCGKMVAVFTGLEQMG